MATEFPLIPLPIKEAILDKAVSVKPLNGGFH